MSSATTKTAKDIILTTQSTWEAWYNNIKSSVQSYLWKYFDPEQTDKFLEPICPKEPYLEPSPAAPSANLSRPSTRSTPTITGETQSQQSAREGRNKKKIDFHQKQYNIYKDKKRDWEKSHDVQTKLRDQIKATVAADRTKKLDSDLSVCQWLHDLKASTAPPLVTTQQNIRIDYQ